MTSKVPCIIIIEDDPDRSRELEDLAQELAPTADIRVHTAGSLGSSLQDAAANLLQQKPDVLILGVGKQTRLLLTELSRSIMDSTLYLIVNHVASIDNRVLSLVRRGGYPFILAVTDDKIRAKLSEYLAKLDSAR